MFTKNSPRWDVSRYPANWAELSLQCRIAANWTCANCGVKHGDTRISKAGKEYIVYLAACHVFPDDESNPCPELICLCVACHGKYDTAYKALKARGKIATLQHRLNMVKRLLALKGLELPIGQETDLTASVSQLVSA